MIRGVNKRIIEINDTGSEYFEKALFFVKNDEYTSSAQHEKEAKRMMDTYFNGETSNFGFLRQRARNRKRSIFWGSVVAFSVIVTIVLLYFIF